MRKALLAIWVLAAPLPAGAHDTWVLPVRWNVPVRGQLILDLTSAMDFPTPETAARPDRLVDRSIRLNGVVSSLEVSTPPPGAKALQLSARPAAAGLATVWIATRPRTLDLKPDEVEHYLQEIGAVDTVGEQWRRSPNKAWRETYVKVAKTFVRVGDARKDDSWREAVGASLELVPASDPTALSTGQDLALLLLSKGKPIADLAVGAVAGAPARPVLVRTDAEGRVTFRLDRPGPWLFRATLIRPVAGRQGEWESVFTTVTVDVKIPTPSSGPTSRFQGGRLRERHLDFQPRRDQEARQLVVGAVDDPRFPEKNLEMVVMVYVLHMLERPLRFWRTSARTSGQEGGSSSTTRRLTSALRRCRALDDRRSLGQNRLSASPAEACLRSDGTRCPPVAASGRLGLGTSSPE